MENTGEKLTMENTGEKLTPDESKNVLTIDDIPPELLLKIFGCLTRMELIAAQCVCCTWRTVAHDKSLWKDYTFVVSGTPENERRLTVMPALQNIDGHADNNFINIILDHVTNLNKMNCKYKPPISFMQVQSIVQKYPGLQSITLDVCAVDILQSVKVLQTSERITELILHKEMQCISSFGLLCECSSLSEFLNILNIFADPKNFPTLSNVNVNGLTCAGAFENPLFVSVFTRVLANRSHQLQSLNLDISSAVDVGVINALNMCSTIQNLRLIFHKKCPAYIDISHMAKLRFLAIRMYKNDEDFLIALYDSLSTYTSVYLTEVIIYIHNNCHYTTDILGVLTKNARQLRKLSYRVLSDYINERQLKHIGNLSRLERLSVSLFQNISEEIMTYISHCYNLKGLYLSALSSNITDLKTCIADMIHSLKQLECLWVDDHSVFVKLFDKEKVKMFLSHHGNDN